MGAFAGFADVDIHVKCYRLVLSGQGAYILPLNSVSTVNTLLIRMIFLSGGGPYCLAMQGRTYHRIFPTDSTRHEHPAQWLLYDSSRRNAITAKHNIPSSFVNAVCFDLEQRNMLYHVYQRFSELNLSQRMHTLSLLTLVLETKLLLCSISEMHRTPPLDRFTSNVLLTLHRHQFLYLIPYTNQCNIHYYFHMRHQAP